MGQFYRFLLTLFFTALITIFVIDFQLVIDFFDTITGFISQLLGRGGY
ncbi:MAG: hypothetical protein ACK4K9_03830 [Bacteroidia bacterium]